MKAQVIMPTAGLGTRMGNPIPKPLLPLQDKPLFIHTLQVIDQCQYVDSVIILVHMDYIDQYKKVIDEFGITKSICITPGGETRTESVWNGLSQTDSDTTIVAIHDGARPLVEAALIDQAIKQCQSDQAVVVGVPVKSTIKKAKECNQKVVVAETVPRDQLWEIQTPQVFQKHILQQAYESNSGAHVTDDASLVEAMGIDITILKGSYRNIKVTTQEDMAIAEGLLKDDTT